MSRVVLEGVTKRFGDEVAVDRLSLEIEDGDFFSLLGPSGCGKTTTMRLIAGLERPDEGRIWIGDQLVCDAADGTFVPAPNRRLGMVFQNYALWPHMTVEDNIRFGLHVRKVPESEQRQRLTDVIKQLQIEGLEKRYPNELSGGQQQRIALARELVTQAGVLMMDEPLSNLDAKLRIDMRLELKRLHADTGRTIIYVTHDQLEALTLSRRMAVMSKGLVQQVGSPDEVFMRPANVFVASFMGQSTINTFPATLDAGAVRGEGFEMPIVAAASGDGRREGAGSRQVVVAARPEELTLHRTASVGALHCEVVSELPMGYTSLVQVRPLDIGEERFVTLEHPRSDAVFEPGTEVWVGIEAARVHVFDAATNQRVVVANAG